MMARMVATTEIWKPVPGYEGWYSVSSLGRIRRDRGGTSAKPGAMLKLNPQALGYLAVSLCKHGKVETFRVSRLVCHAFFGPPFPDAQADHINGDPGDNRVENLRWVTPMANTHLAYHRNGSWPSDKRRHKLNGAQVRLLREFRRISPRWNGRNSGVLPVLARAWGVSRAIVYLTANGQRYLRV